MFRPGEFVGLRPGWSGCGFLAGREVRVGEGGREVSNVKGDLE